MSSTLAREIDAARDARRRQRGRSVRQIAQSLAAAAVRWRDDAELAAALPDAANLHPTMVEAVLPLVAEALDADAMITLAEREGGTDGPALVAHVLASNVPALAVPAIALGCLAGAAVVVKSGRADTLSAPAFRRCLATVDPGLAATVVTTYWSGGDVEDAVLGRADVVVASGSDATMAALARRFGPRLITHGSRTSVVVARDDADASAIALDVALYEQRGCLSPHTVLVAGNAPAFAERLHAALIDLAGRLPPVAATTAERAAHRLAVETASFAGVTVLSHPAGTVVVGEPGGEIGRRTVFVREGTDVAAALAPGTIECVGVAGVPVDVEGLRRHGVARICPVGRMQRPRLDWPRGQRPALGSLFRDGGEPRIQVET